MINCDIRTGKVRIGKANYVIILDHFVSFITTCYHYYFLGSTPAASTSLRLERSEKRRLPRRSSLERRRATNYNPQFVPSYGSARQPI